jgi:hypothetical protein
MDRLSDLSNPRQKEISQPLQPKSAGATCCVARGRGTVHRCAARHPLVAQRQSGAAARIVCTIVSVPCDRLSAEARGADNDRGEMVRRR